LRFLLTIFLLIPIFSFGQFRGEGKRAIGVDVFKGFILKHKPSISHLIIDHPVGFRVTFDKQTFGSEAWEKRYNYPDIGLTFTYLDYKNEVLGKTISIIPHYQLYLTKNRQARSQFNYKIGLGLGYHTEKYDKVDNNKNNALSTDFSFGVIFQAGHKYRLTDRLDLTSTITLTHFSNGSIKKPNSGINVISANLGLSYKLDNIKKEYLNPDDEPLDKSGFGYTFSFTSGMHEAVVKGGGSYPFYTFSLLADKTLNHKSKLGLMIDWFHSMSLKEEIQYDETLNGETPDFNRVGIGLSHELVLNDYSVVGQIGYYVYAPYEPFEPIYLRLGLRKYFNDNIYSSISVKSHYAKAEAAEFAIGWRFK